MVHRDIFGAICLPISLVGNFYERNDFVSNTKWFFEITHTLNSDFYKFFNFSLFISDSNRLMVEDIS